MPLIEKGLALSKALEAKALEFHPKSNVHEALSWEAVGITTRVNDLRSGKSEARVDTGYKDIDWGANLQEFSPALAKAVRDFYKEYYGQ